jgi:spermidine synthase
LILFLSSFLVLFLEVALIRWIPAYVRLLSYFSNFILLASFLGIGLGCLLAARRRDLFVWFPLLQLALIVAIDRLRLEVAIPSSASLFFSSGTANPVVPVESTRLLPLIFVAVAALFVTAGQRMARELARQPALRAYIVNLLGSLAGVAAFAAISWLQLPPVVWFGAAAAAAAPLVAQERRGAALVNAALLALALVAVYRMERGSLWSPYYRITVFQDRSDTVVEVNQIFHQSMAPLRQKEYFYEWPYAVFGNTFEDVLILGAGTGTDVAAALAHGARHVDAVEIDPAILRLGTERHPDRPYQDPRVTAICDDARHFLTTTHRKYDLVVFALIDSLTVQSSFASVRLESYMFTEESFRAVRDHLTPRGLLVLYNYFREPWLVDRLANTIAAVFGREPRAHVHQERAYLAVMLAGPRVEHLSAPLPLPDRVLAYGQSHDPSPARPLVRDASVVPATDDWPFLYMRSPTLPRHYAAALAVVLAVSLAAVLVVLRTESAHTEDTEGTRRNTVSNDKDRDLPVVTVSSVVEHVSNHRWSWPFFWLGAGFMLLETKSIVQFALLWGSTWSSASLAIASVLVMALASAIVAARVEVRRRGVVAVALFALIAIDYALPIGRVSFASRTAETIFYAALMFSPVFCAGLLFSTAFRRSTSTAADFGANLMGAMVGGVAEYSSLVAGYKFLLILVAVSYALALAQDKS